MLKGFNSDIRFGDVLYHVQTEDWGTGNPFLVTRVFKNGAVVYTHKTPYHQVLPNAQYDPKLLADALKLQHYQILDQISNGQLYLGSKNC